MRRSHLDKTIVLLEIGDRYVPIVETAVKILGENVETQADAEAQNNVADDENQNLEMESVM